MIYGWHTQRIPADDPKANVFSGVKAIADRLHCRKRRVGSSMRCWLPSADRPTRMPPSCVGPEDRCRGARRHTPHPLTLAGPARVDRQGEHHSARAIKSGRTVTVRRVPHRTGDGRIPAVLMVIRSRARACLRPRAAFRIRVQRRHELLLSHARLETTPSLSTTMDCSSPRPCILRPSDRLRRSWRCSMRSIDPFGFWKPPWHRAMNAASLACNRVASIPRGRCVQVQAMSHTLDTFNRGMQGFRPSKRPWRSALTRYRDRSPPAESAIVSAGRPPDFQNSTGHRPC